MRKGLTIFMMNSNASEYGLALFNLACETSSQKEIFDDFSQVNEVFKTNSEMVRLLMNPRLSVNERAEVIENVFGGSINRYLLNMLKLLAEKRIIRSLENCWLSYRDRYCEANGILAATAVSAVELNEDQKSRLVEKLSKKTGCKILLTCRVDKACIGGVRLEYGGKRYDASVSSRLTSLKKSLTSEY